MGMTSALKARRALRNAEVVLGIELLVAAQALEFRKPLRPGAGVLRAYERLRERVPPLGTDRNLSKDIEAAAALVREGAFTVL